MRRPALPILFFLPILAAQTAHPQSVPPVSVPTAPTSQAPAAQPLAPQVEAAEADIASTNWKAAESKLDMWLAAHPNDGRALFDAGYVADVQNRTADASRLYQRAVKADPSSFDAHLMLGMLLAREGKTAEARPELLHATQLDPGAGGPELKARAWRALARIDSANNPAEASSDLLEALKLSPETTDDTLLAASLAAQSGQIEAAEQEYRRVLAKDPNSERATTALAHLLIEQKKFPEAEALLRPAYEKSPNDPALTAQLAVVFVAENKAEAVPLLQKLHSEHPGDATITKMLAEVLADAGEFAASDRLYLTLLAASPRDASLLIAHGQNLVQEKQFAQALAVFRAVTQINPSSGEAWGGLAFTASKEGKPSLALHALTMRAKYLPDNASTYFLWAVSYDSLNERSQAAVYYHHFLDSAGGKFPDQEWQARQRLKLLQR